MKIIVGLGNPGKEYEKTRHNAGAMCVDLLRKELDLPQFKLQKKFEALISEGTYKNEKIILAKPQTFMNLSGESVQRLIKFYNCPIQNLIVVYDDVDLPLGRIRVRPNGSAGSHNGMKSVTKCLSSTNFARVRIGIESRGESAPSKQEISSNVAPTSRRINCLAELPLGLFVLKSFTKAETETFKTSLENAAKAIILILEKSVDDAMQLYN